MYVQSQWGSALSPSTDHEFRIIQGRKNPSRRRSGWQLDQVTEASEFADHLARPHLLRFFADGWSAFLVLNAFVQDLPNQSTEPVAMAPIACACPRRGTSRRDHCEDRISLDFAGEGLGR